MAEERSAWTSGADLDASVRVRVPAEVARRGAGVNEPATTDAPTLQGHGDSVRRRRRWGAILVRSVIVAASGAVSLGVAAAMVISHTTAGRDFALDWALERVRPALNGTLTIGGIGPSGLLAGTTLYEVELSDAAGRRVLAADSIRARYSIAELFGGPPAIADLRVWSPVVHLEPHPGEPVSVAGLLAGGGTEADAEAAAGAGSDSPLFRIRGARIHGGAVVMRDENGAEERVDGIEADLSRVDIAPSGDVDLAAGMDEVALSLPLGRGRLELSGLRGDLVVGSDDIVVRAERFRLPGSEGSGSMQVDIRDDPWVTILDLDVARTALEDLRWLDERLDHGSARGALRIVIDGDDLHVDVASAEVGLEGGVLAFAGGLSVTGTTRFRSLRVAPDMLATAELEPWLPDTLPAAGLLSGDVVFDGAPGRLEVTGDLSLTDRATGATLAGASGGGTLLEAGAFEEAAVSFTTLEYELLAEVLPWVWWEGRGSLDLELDGHLATGMELRIAATRWPEAGPESSVVLDGTVFGDTTISVVDVDATLSPLDLSIVRELRPDFPLTGPVGGSVSLTGPLERLGIAAELETTAGALSAEGNFNARDLAAGYQVTVSAGDFRLSEWFGELPDSTVVSATAALSGRGLDLDSLRGSLVVEAGPSAVGALRVDTARLNAWVDEAGLMHVETLHARAGGVTVQGMPGSVGAVDGAVGEGVNLSVSSPSIRGLRPLFMGEGLVAWDELSPIEQDVMIEFDGVDPDTFPTAHEIRFDGRLDGQIRLQGWLGGLEAQATVALSGFEYGPSSAARAGVEVTAGGLSLVGADTSAGPPAPILLEGGVTGDSISIEGRDFRSGRIDGRFALGEGGRLRALLRRSGDEHYEAQAVVRLDDGGGRIDLDRLSLVLPERRWGLQGPASLDWSADSVVVNDFGLIRPGIAGLRLFADGRLVRGAGESDFELSLTDLDLGVLSRVLQLDEPLAGVASAELFASGTAANPVWQGSARLGEAVYRALSFDSIAAAGSYADGAMDGLVESWSAGRRSLRIDGRVPMDLRLASVEDRMPDRPLRIELAADAFPAAMVLPALTGLEEVGGAVSGLVTIAGTRSSPQPDGRLRLENATGFSEALGVRLASVHVDARLSPDGTVALAGIGASGEGTVRMSGTVDASRPDDPLLDLAFWPQGFQVIDRRDMEIAVSGDSITLGGSFNYPLVQGSLEASDGTVFLEEFQRTSQTIDFYDPELFTAATREFGLSAREGGDGVARGRNPFLQNLRVLIDLHVGPGNWLRSRDMNVETTGDLSATFDRQGNQLVLHGGIDVVRGTYSLGPRTLRMTDGTFQFVGTPGFNPGIALTAENRMHTREGEPLVITADISGTLLSPRLALSSDADAISDADLPSYIVFGRPASALIGEGGAASFGAGRDLLLAQVINQFGYLLALELDVDHLSVSQAEQSQANAAFGASSLQVEVGWYVDENVFLTGVYQRGFCGDPTLPVGSGGVRVEVGMPRDMKLEGFVEGRCTRERYRGLGDLSLKLARIWGFSLFREWGY